MVTEEQFAELGNKIDRLSSRSIHVPKKNGVDWTKVAGILITLGAIAGSIIVGYIVQTKADAATQHTKIKDDAVLKYETQKHAAEVHNRHDKRAEKSIEKIEALYDHVIERKPRRDVRVHGGDDDGN